MVVFKEKEAAKRPKRYQPLSFQHAAAAAPAPAAEGRTDAVEISLRQAGGRGAGAVGMEVFCNPNMHSSAFNATALVTLTMAPAAAGAAPEMRVVTECELSALKAHVDEFLSAGP